MAYSMAVAGAQVGSLAITMYEQATWIKVMAVAFETADVERAAILKNGTWLARTDSLQRYATVDTYA